MPRVLTVDGSVKIGAYSDCFNYNCPFRVNETSSVTRCECIACPNRCHADRIIISDKTLSDEELSKFLREE